MEATKVAAHTPFDTPEYWLALARNERAFAEEDRKRRYGTVEGVRIHERNAAEYEARAAALTKPCPICSRHGPAAIAKAQQS